MVSAARVWMAWCCMLHVCLIMATIAASNAASKRPSETAKRNARSPLTTPATTRSNPSLPGSSVRTTRMHDVHSPESSMWIGLNVDILVEIFWCILPCGAAWLIESSLFSSFRGTGSATKLARSPNSASPTSLEEATFHTLQLLLVSRAAGLQRMEEWLKHPSTIWMEDQSSSVAFGLRSIAESMWETRIDPIHPLTSSATDMSLLRVLGAYISALVWYLSSWRRLLAHPTVPTTAASRAVRTNKPCAHSANSRLAQEKNNCKASKDKFQSLHPKPSQYRLGTNGKLSKETECESTLSLKSTCVMPRQLKQRIRNTKRLQRKKDHWCMTTHHLLASGLLFLSLYAQQMQAGLAVMAVHDVADPMLHLAKWMRKRGKATLADTFFITFALLFIVGRIVWLPWMTWCASSAARNSIEMLLVGMLAALVPLHLFWTIMIARAAWRRWQGNDLEDERSDEEDEGGNIEKIENSQTLTRDDLLPHRAADQLHMESHLLHRRKTDRVPT